ncbi:sugar transferase [Streptomyces sp. NPDC093252]|uniref:sugar transferase n=1 Tax=Streptomyces sp. NPDC093252 TaxID=3154980 RepID=UPI003421C084
MEELGNVWEGKRIPRQSYRVILSEENDPAGEALLAGYMAEVDEAADRIVTAKKTDELLLKIKVKAFTQAAVESHASGDDTLTNLVIQRDLLESSGAACPPTTRRRPARPGLRWALTVQLTATALALWQFLANGGGRSGTPDAVTITAMAASFAVTAAMLLRRPVKQRAVTGLGCEPIALPLGRRIVDVAVAVIALLATTLPMAATALLVALRGGGPVIERNARVGQGGYPIRLLKYRSSQSSSRTSRWLRVAEHFPRLWNLLRGDLTLVGPKPEPPDVAARYPDECRWVFHHRPGLIGAVYEDARHLETDPDRYLAEVVPAQVNVLCREVLLDKRLALRLFSNAVFAMLVIRPGSGPRLGVPLRADAGSPPSDGQQQEGTASKAPTERIRLERWSLHETVA